MGNSSADKGKQKVHNIKPKKEKKPFTFLAKSIITVLVLMAVEGCFVLALNYVDYLSLRFEWVVDKLEWAEQYIYNFMSGANNIVLSVLVILFIFFIKAYIPFLPLSIVCLLGGSFFGKYWWVAVFINLLGLAMMFYLRFNSGRVKGENYMQNLIRRNKYMRFLLDDNGISSYTLLAVFRFFPCFPLNFVSRLYGANKDCKFSIYMLISVLAVAPRVYVYTRMGKELFNPFSKTFIILLMFFAGFSGLGIFIANTVIYIKRKKEVNKKLQADLELQLEAEAVFDDDLDYSEQPQAAADEPEIVSEEPQKDVKESAKEKYVPVFDSEVSPEAQIQKHEKTGSKKISNDIENLRNIFHRNL